MTVEEYRKLKKTLKDCLKSATTHFDPPGAGLLARALVELENHRKRYGLSDD
jgi:hypothetical protein